MEIPDEWKSISVDGCDCLGGITLDLGAFKYTIVVVNPKKSIVWQEIRSEEEISTKLNDQGFLDLDKEKLGVFLKRFEEAFNTTEFECEGQDGSLEFIIKTGAADWTCSLTTVTSNEIWGKLFLSQISNLAFRKFQIDNLIQKIRLKDHYITYLAENYKQINGDELLQKYKNIALDVLSTNKFDLNVWDSSVKQQYVDTDAIKQFKRDKSIMSSPRKRARTKGDVMDQPPVKFEIKPDLKPPGQKRRKQGMFRPKKKP